MKKLPLSFKYTHNVYFYKGSITFAFKLHAIHTRKKQKSNIFYTLDDQVMADNPFRLIDVFTKIFAPRRTCNYCRNKQTFKTGFWSGKK